MFPISKYNPKPVHFNTTAYRSLDHLELEINQPEWRDHNNYSIRTTGARRFVTVAVRTGLFFLSEIQARGVENLPGCGGVILAANHLTNFDILPLQVSLNRTIIFMGKEELFRNPLIGRVYGHLGAFPIRRGSRDDWALDHARMVLEAGETLGMFPEGRRSKGRGLAQGKTGTAHLALQIGCPIVPTAITGTHQMFSRFPRRNRITITLGEPLHPEPDESPQALTDRLMVAIAALLPPNLRGLYAEKV
jgi:1-acyl-sn-glycerol-3-phosphate acyltransferase